MSKLFKTLSKKAWTVSLLLAASQAMGAQIVCEFDSSTVYRISRVFQNLGYQTVVTRSFQAGSSIRITASSQDLRFHAKLTALTERGSFSIEHAHYEGDYGGENSLKNQLETYSATSSQLTFKSKEKLGGKDNGSFEFSVNPNNQEFSLTIIRQLSEFWNGADVTVYGYCSKLQIR